MNDSSFTVCLALLVAALSVALVCPEAAEAKRKRRAATSEEAAPADDAQPEELEEDPYGAEASEDEPEAEPAAGEGSAAKTEADSAQEGGSVLDQEEDADGGSLRRSGRLEFDERLVKGQAAKSGAVYLFKRVPRRLPGLVPMRRSYRRRIVEPVLGRREIEPARPREVKDGEERDGDGAEGAASAPAAASATSAAADAPAAAKPKARRKGRERARRSGGGGR